MGNIKISDLPLSQRPMEKLLKYGADSLGNEELLAILLRTGTKGENVIELSTRLISNLGGLDKILDASYEEIKKIKGIKNDPTDVTYIMLDSDYINQTVTAETDDNSDSIVTKICPFADKCKLLVYKHSTYEILCSKTDIVKGTTEFTIEKMNDNYNNVKMLKEIAIRARTLTLESAVRA